MRLFTVLCFSICLLLSTTSTASAVWDDGWWNLDFQNTTGTPANPLRVGIDLGDGAGFDFFTLTDDDSDGTIPIPRVPVGGRLALGVNHAGGQEDCDLWDLFGPQVSGGPVVRKPLLIIAEDIPGVALGVDYGNFAIPPLTLTPGQRFTAIDGRISEWPDVRLVNEFAVPGLEEFVQLVDTLPNFSGDVVVSTAMLTGTFVVPEPVSSLLLLGGFMITASRRVCLRK